MGNGARKPFYLRVWKTKPSHIVISSLFVITFSLINYYFFIAMAFPIYLFFRGKKYERSPFIQSLNSSVISFEKGDFNKCYLKALEVTKLKPENNQALILEGLSLLELKDYNASIQCFEKVPKKIIYNDVFLVMKFGEAYLNARDYKKAREVFLFLLKVQPNSDYLKMKLDECTTE